MGVERHIGLLVERRGGAEIGGGSDRIFLAGGDRVRMKWAWAMAQPCPSRSSKRASRPARMRKGRGSLAFSAIASAAAERALDRGSIWMCCA